MDKIHLTQNRDQRGTLVNTVTKTRIPQNAVNFSPK
jgi:hypothetical protein